MRDIRMRERAYNFSAHFRVGRGARTVLYQRLSILSRNLLRMIRSLKFYARGPIPRANLQFYACGPIPRANL
jgi:hypothetical protein